MRFGTLIAAALLLSAACCSATTLTDPFLQTQTNCNYSSNQPYSSCDVIGNEQLFDIQGATLTASGGIATLVIYVNSGAVKTVNNQLTLGPFTDGGFSLIPGDVFFYNPQTVYDPSDPNTTQYLKYGVALTSHGSFTAGGLYSIGSGVSTDTAQTALNDVNAYYRKDEVVLLSGSGAPVSAGSVSVANNGDGTAAALYAITVSVPTTTGLQSLMYNGEIGVLFSSADCGNDVLQGVLDTTTQTTPEPGSALLLLTGVVLLVAGRQWRKRTE